MPTSKKKPEPEEGQAASPGCESIEQLLTAQQVASILQISDQIVYRMAARGELPSVGIGRAIRFIPSTVQQWIKEREQLQQEEQERIRASLDPWKYRQVR